MFHGKKNNEKYVVKSIQNFTRCQVISLSLFVFFVFQVLISISSYSGQNNSPKFGDYEAQRHWMEITYHLPITDWYRDTKDNNLTYWGLDYPPLTAYHSLFLGFVSDKINKDWVALHESHGFQGLNHKLFMRSSVIVSNIFLYGTSLVFFHNTKTNGSLKKYLSMLLYPCLLLIDCGHFQYNHVALGLTIWAFFMLQRNKFFSGAFFFVMALNFKQISLYYSLPFFVYILSKCRSYTTNGKLSYLRFFQNIFLMGIITILSFLILWFPFCQDINDAKNVISRIFPVSRGIFEDKVASFWCVFSVIFRNLRHIPHEIMVPICTLCVLLCCMPSLIMLYKRTTKFNMIRALFCCSSAFFLFSYHVHEKSILFPGAIMTLYIPYDSTLALWFLIISSLSVYPLLLIDNIPESIFIIFAYYITFMFTDNNKNYSKKTIITIHCSIILGFIVTLSTFFLPHIPRYPYIYQLLVATYSFIHFIVFYVLFNFIDEVSLNAKSINTKKNK
uniref:Alpha-1,3-glucosyltransferase n=1 Tax=Strongyloides papillosus TaxID=174720 RepID=A0A0N5BKE7_STREA